MIKLIHIALLLPALVLAGCCCPNAPEPLPAGSVPLTNGYGPVVAPQPTPAPAPAPRPTAARKRTSAKKRTTARKAPVKKAAVKKPTAAKRTVRRAPRSATAARQVIPPAPAPLGEAQETGREPERLQ